MTRSVRRWAAPLSITAALLAARVASAPALTDPTGAPLPAGLSLSTPWLHVVAAPLFTLWDGMSMLSMSRLESCLLGFAALYVSWRVIRWWQHRRVLRELGFAALALAGFALFIVAGAIWHRPMVSLSGAPAGMVVVDFHSHSNASHDVKGIMRNWDVQAVRRWHARAGFDAFFLTDHNTQNTDSRQIPPGTPYVCPGIEISAWRAHVVLLGTSEVVDRTPYTQSQDGVLALLRDAPTTFGAISIASIPEYERNHWDNLTAWVAAGLGGFEIVNASPKANEFSRVRRDSVIALARRSNRIVLGVSDQHGWGATSMVWNLVSASSEQPRSGDPCAAILSRLTSSGFQAVQVVERHRLRADSAWPTWLTAIGLVWETWRAMSWPLVLGWLAWIWLGAALAARFRHGRSLVSTHEVSPELAV